MAQKETGPKSLAEALAVPGGALAGLAARAAAQSKLTDHVRRGLGSGAAGHLVSCTVREDGVMSVAVDSPAWAARLRFEVPGLLARGRELHPGLKQVEVRVARQGG